jgi:predicted transcriptional regulator
MRRKTFHIREEQNRRLKDLAIEAGVSRNALVRRALDQYLEKISVPNDNPGKNDFA